MEYRKLVYAETYEKNGEKKNLWHPCGTMFFGENGNISIRLTSFPLSGNIMAFPNKPKEATQDISKTAKELEGEKSAVDELPF